MSSQPPSEPNKDVVPHAPRAMSKNYDLVLETRSGARFFVNEEAMLKSSKLAIDILLANATDKIEGMRVVKLRGEHPDDQVKFVLSCLDAVASGTNISFAIVQCKPESGFVGVLVTAHDIFHEFGIESLEGLKAALNNALTDTVQSMRHRAEHPGVHIIRTSTGVRRVSPTLKVGPGDLVAREVVAGAAAVWAANRPWEMGRAKMLEAVCSCMPYLPHVEGFEKLMSANHDFAATFAKAVTDQGRMLPKEPTAKAVAYNCKHCGQERQLSRSPELNTFVPGDILRRSSSTIVDGPYLELWCDVCALEMIQNESEESLHPETCTVCPVVVREYSF